MSKRYDLPTSRLICFDAKATTNSPVGHIAPEVGLDQLFDP